MNNKLNKFFFDKPVKKVFFALCTFTGNKALNQSCVGAIYEPELPRELQNWNFQS